ncbi:TetR/AcrR family transcriptional regulator [Furfurilactobacillus sp. WILCCON 0119]
MTLNDPQTLLSQSLDNEKLSAKQKAVLMASMQLFSEKGFDATSTSDIAQLAGVAEGTVYKHFKTKAMILDVILKPFANVVVPQMAKEFSDEVGAETFETLADFIHYFLTDRLNYFVVNAPTIKIFVQQAFVRADLVNSIMTNALPMVQKRLAPIFQSLRRRGELVDWSDVRIIRYIFGAAISYAAPLLVTNQLAELDVAATVSECTEFLVRGLRA